LGIGSRDRDDRWPQVPALCDHNPLDGLLPDGEPVRDNDEIDRRVRSARDPDHRPRADPAQGLEPPHLAAQGGDPGVGRLLLALDTLPGLRIGLALLGPEPQNRIPVSDEALVAIREGGVEVLPIPFESADIVLFRPDLGVDSFRDARDEDRSPPAPLAAHVLDLDAGEGLDPRSEHFTARAYAPEVTARTEDAPLDGLVDIDIAFALQHGVGRPSDTEGLACADHAAGAVRDRPGDRHFLCLDDSAGADVAPDTDLAVRSNRRAFAHIAVDTNGARGLDPRAGPEPSFDLDTPADANRLSSGGKISRDAEDM